MFTTNFIGSDLFLTAATSLVDAIDGFRLNRKATKISDFKAKYSTVLNEANGGTVQLISQGGKRYLLLSEEQVIALAEQSKQTHTMADVIEAIDPPSSELAMGSLYLKRAERQPFELPDHGSK